MSRLLYAALADIRAALASLNLPTRIPRLTYLEDAFCYRPPLKSNTAPMKSKQHSHETIPSTAMKD